MKFSANKKTVSWFVIIAGVVIVLFYTFWNYGGIPIRINSDEKDGVVAREVMTVTNAILVHRDEVHLLFVSGKRYSNVRGAFPFYLWTPDLRGIVFVAERNNFTDADGTLYFVDLKNHQTHIIPCREFRFGYGIGLGRDTVESFDGETLTLRRITSTLVQEISVNVKTGAVRQNEPTRQP